MKCPPAEHGNPFRGSLLLSGKNRLADSIRLDDLQSYRNLRHSLLERRCQRAAHEVRAFELRAERRYENKSVLLRAVNWLYDYSSFYGTSPERALGFMGTLIAYNGMLIGLNGMYDTNVRCADVERSSWVSILCDEKWVSVIASFLLALQPFVNPLGILDDDQIVRPSSFWLLLWFWFSNITVVSLLALTWLGVRRRMKD